MMKFGIMLSLLLGAYLGNSQNHPYQIKFSYQIENGIANGTISPTKAGTLYSFINKYYESNNCSEFPISWGVDTLSLENYKLVDALSHVVSEAQKSQIVIISENHLKPQHRIFANSVITELSKFGFDHLGLETFSSIANSNSLLDSNLVDRGYPLNSQVTGIYSMEPKMGELVRNAISHNYKLFAYERSRKIEGKDRDEIQADNIIRYLNSHPNKKIIILCGFHHAIESEMPKRVKYKWMAKYLKDKSGINPLTVYQDNFTEKYIKNEHPILKLLKITKPSLYVNSENEAVKFTDNIDLEIVHPITRYRNGRPDWLFENDDYKSIDIEIKTNEINFPLMISAFRKGEINSVPVDRVEMKHKYDHKMLVLKTGEYRIEIYDGESGYEYDQSVK